MYTMTLCRLIWQNGCVVESFWHYFKVPHIKQNFNSADQRIKEV
jgi:hypothetical protein